MTIQGWGLIALFTIIIIALAKPIGMWLFALYEGRRTPLHAVLGPVESGFYKLGGIDPKAEQGWRRYMMHMLMFNFVLLLLTYFVLRFQDLLPMNPRGYPGITPDGAFNIAISFTTNTNWQWYSGEVALSNFSQMFGLTIHMFASAATGIALAFALFRGFARREADARQFLGRHDARHALRAAAGLHRLYALSDRERRAADLRPIGRRHHARRRQAEHRARAGRVAGSDQDARHQRWRLLQRQLRPSVREPDRAHQPRPDALDLRDRRRADLDASARRSAIPARAGRSSPR